MVYENKPILTFIKMRNYSEAFFILPAEKISGILSSRQNTGPVKFFYYEDFSTRTWTNLHYNRENYEVIVPIFFSLFLNLIHKKGVYSTLETHPFQNHLTFISS